MKNSLYHIKQHLLQHKTLIQNFSYLSALQIFNILIPLVTYPYLIRVLGKETYGLVVYAQVIVTYLQILVDWGFDTSATKEVSVHRDDKVKLSEIYSSVFILKGLLFLLTLGLLGLLMRFIPEAEEHASLFWLSMWFCLYNVLFPVWFFQGLEKMKYITILTLVGRGLFLALIFILIKSPGDYLMVPLINGLGAVVTGTIAVYVVLFREKVKFRMPSWKTLYRYFHDSADFFISNVSIKVFVSSNKFIIGTFLGLTELAYYDLADKIVSLFRTVPQDIVRNTIYPLVARTRNLEIVRKTTVVMGIYALLAVAFVNALAPQIVWLLGGESMMPCVDIVRLYSVIILTNHLSNYYVTVGLWSFGYIRVFRNLMMVSSALYLLVYGLFWLMGSINLYTITLTPVLIDIYLVVYIFVFWNRVKSGKSRAVPQNA